MGTACVSYLQAESLAAKRKESGIAPRDSPKGASKGLAKDSLKDSSKDSLKDSSRDLPKNSSKDASKPSPKKGKGAHKNAERKDDPLSTEVIGEKEDGKKMEDDFMDDGRRGDGV